MSILAESELFPWMYQQRSGLFWPLFQYIQGNNSDSAKIDMTTPVTTLVSSTSTTVTLEMCFFLGPLSSWPAPSDPAVYLQEAGERRVVTRRVGGYMNTLAWTQEAADLAQVVQGLGLQVEEGRRYQVGYDAPFKF